MDNKRFQKLIRTALGLETKQYGGAVFSTVCPTCKAIVVMAKSLNVNRFMSEFLKKIPRTVPGICKLCGPVRLPFISFEKEIAQAQQEAKDA
ncbi:hypothetical protein LCGC14_1436320 [marine sediment metagenome]|uniref:Uncharacterized protein n=1 Tax=marine sediment metagenome TaxID=412755 RepID=A0A0F9MNX7_9ZZZZ